MKVCLSCGHTFPSGDGWTCPDCHWAPECNDSWPMFTPKRARVADGFSPELFATLAHIEPNHFWFRARNRLLVWALAKYFHAARSFLEIGCGTGYVLSGIHAALPNLSVSGSEVFSEGLAFARSRLPDVPLYQLDARRLPFEEEFDVVGAFDVLEHIDQDDVVLRQLFQAVRPNGGILLTVPQHPFLWSKTDDYASHQRRYTRSDLVAKVESAGFQVVRATSFVSTLLPLVFISRLVRDRCRVDSSTEFDVHPLANLVFEHILDLERAVIALGLSLPVGVSLLVVARRPSPASVG